MTEQLEQAGRSGRAELNLSKGWVQGVALVMIFGFFVMGMLALRTYTDSMPLPDEGDRAERRDRLHRGRHHGRPADLPAPRPAAVRLGDGPRRLSRARLHRGVPAHVRRATSRSSSTRRRGAGPQPRRPRTCSAANRYDEDTANCSSPPSRSRHSRRREVLRRLLRHRQHEVRPAPKAITDPQEIHELTAFFSWTAWASAAERPGHSYSYTNNWPLGAAGRQHPDRRHRRVVRAVAGGSAGRSGRPVRALRAVEPTDRLARHGTARRWPSGSPARCRSPRPRRSRPGSSSSSRCSSSVQTLLGGAIEHYRADLAELLRLRPGAQCCPSTWPAPGTCSCRCSGRPRRSWPPASSWRRSSPGASRAGSTG